MGTDIHAIIEYTHEHGTGWFAAEIESLGRNYALFDAIAGGRSESGYVIAPRGLPEDASETTIRRFCTPLNEKFNQRLPYFRSFVLQTGEQFAYYHSGYGMNWLHSFTWITADELVMCQAAAGIQNLDESWLKLLARMRDLERATCAVRLVVCFDS